MRFNRDFELAINLLRLLDASDFQTAKSLAEGLDTTELYLQKIILKLRKADIVETLSGGQGGVRRKAETNALEILKALKRIPKKLEGRADKILTNVLTSLSKETL